MQTLIIVESIGSALFYFESYTLTADSLGFTPTMYAILEIAGDFSSISREDNKSEIMRLMLRESDCEIDITQYANSKEAFSLIQRHTDPLYFLRALSERVEIASKICWTSVFGASPAVFKAALGDSFDMAQLKSETDSSGRTVLHMIAMALVRIVSVILRPEWWKSYPNRYLDEAQADLQGELPLGYHAVRR